MSSPFGESAHSIITIISFVHNILEIYGCIRNNKKCTDIAVILKLYASHAWNPWSHNIFLLAFEIKIVIKKLNIYIHKYIYIFINIYTYNNNHVYRE